MITSVSMYHKYGNSDFRFSDYTLIVFANSNKINDYTYVKLIYRGYDCISEKHGILLEKLDEKSIKELNNTPNYALCLSLPKAAAKSIIVNIELWHTELKDIEFPVIVNVLAIFLSNKQKLYFVLNDRADADFSISKKEPIDFFKMTYSIDFEERNMILLGRF